MDYRKLYEKEFNIDIPSNYDIHHIDFNHSNNDISNLLMIPNKLHVELHTLEKQYGEMVKNDNGKFNVNTQVEAGIMAHMFARYAVVYEKLEYWVACKENETKQIKTSFNYNIFRK